MLYVLQTFVLRPTLSRLRDSRGKLLIAQQDLMYLRALQQRREAAEIHYEVLTEGLETASSREREIIQMLLAMESAAKGAGVGVLENLHLKDETFEYYQLHTIKFRGSGSLDSIYSLLTRLQDPEIQMKVGKMRLQMKGVDAEVDLEATKVTM